MKLTKRPSTYSYFELLDACKKPGCPICRLGQDSAQRHLTAVIYDGVNDIPLRATLRDSYGYCHEHGWMLPESGGSAPLGIAIIHRDVLNTLRKRLELEKYNKTRNSSIKSLLADALGKNDMYDEEGSQYIPETAACPACERRQEAELLAFASLLEALDKEDQPMRSALEASDGLCIAHLRQALNAARSPQAFESLVTITNRQLNALIYDLDEFIRKSDHRFRDERISMEEGGSWKRALQRASSKKPNQPDK